MSVIPEGKRVALYAGDCLQSLKKLPDNSIDSVVTDPPYGLSEHRTTDVIDCLRAWINGEPYLTKKKGFMNANWDSWTPGPEVWRECLRVLKPGGHMLVFAGTRSMDLMSMAVRLSGFELRDSIGYAHDGGGAPLLAWTYGTGFPKSADVSKQIERQEKDRWVKISKAIDNLNFAELTELWINSKSANVAGVKFQRKATEAGCNTQKNGFAHENVLLQANLKNCDALAVIADLSLIEVHHTSVETCSSAQLNAESSITESKSHATTAEKSPENREATLCIVDFSALQSAWGWQGESKVDKLKAVEALRTWLGSKPSSRQGATNALCAALTDDLKLITLSQSKTFLSFDTTRQTACASAISATITESTAENLISFTVDTLKSKAIDREAGAEREVIGKSHHSRNRTAPDGYGGFTGTDSRLETAPATEAARQWQGWGTALKPAWEPIIIARKPLDGTVAQNVQKWGVGGVNVDGCRIEAERATGWGGGGSNLHEGGLSREGGDARPTQGRWPANLAHDGSDSVLALFPDTAPSKASMRGVGLTGKDKKVFGKGDPNYNTMRGHNDTGSAARFFYSAKASKADRDEGLEGFATVSKGSLNMRSDAHAERNGNTPNPRANTHPTVKPTSLMQWLCRLITPPGGIVLDPFMGSGSTGKAAMLEGFRFVGMEMSPDYMGIAKARIRHAMNKHANDNTEKECKAAKQA